jgi:hypothetical protein
VFLVYIEPVAILMHQPYHLSLQLIPILMSSIQTPPPIDPTTHILTSPQSPPSPYTFIGRHNASPYVFRNDRTPTPSTLRWLTKGQLDVTEYNADHGIDDGGDDVEVLREVTREELDEKVQIIDLTVDDEMLEGVEIPIVVPMKRRAKTKVEEERYNPPVLGNGAGRSRNGWSEEQERAMWLVHVSLPKCLISHD